MKKYCDCCNKEAETLVTRKKESYNVCGEQIEVESQVLVCAECGEELFSEELDGVTLLTAYNEYRRRHNLLFPDEIRQIREQYGLSQRSFSKLLKWGDKTIRRYENGSIQDSAHNSLLFLLRDPKNMRIYIDNNEIDLPPSQLASLLDAIESADDFKVRATSSDFVSAAESGRKVIANVYDVARYVIKRIHPITTMKLQKLVYYCQAWSLAWGEAPLFQEDFEAWTNGPVCPPLFMSHKGMFKLDKDFLEDIPDYAFSENERDTMDRVLDQYGDKSPKWLSELTHMERPWKMARGDTPLGDPCTVVISKESMMLYYGGLVRGEDEEYKRFPKAAQLRKSLYEDNDSSL